MTRPSRSAEQGIASAGGRNRYGGPNFRVVLGCERGYKPKGNWHLERWMSPEDCGSRASWDYEELGPFPEHGDYEHCFALEGSRGERLVPDYDLEAVLELVRLLVRSRDLVRTDPRAAKRALLEREERATRRWMNRNDDMLDDLRPAMNGYDFVQKT